MPHGPVPCLATARWSFALSVLPLRCRAEVYDEDGNRLHPEISEEFSEDFAAEHGHGHDLSGEMDEGEDDHGEVYGDHTEVRTAPLLSLIAGGLSPERAPTGRVLPTRAVVTAYSACYRPTYPAVGRLQAT